MKKFLIIFILFASASVHAVCPLDITGESVCTLPDYGQKSVPSFAEQRNSIGAKTEPVRSNSLPDLTPLNINSDKKNGQFQYDSSCQFGVCLQDLNNSNNKNQ